MARLTTILWLRNDLRLRDNPALLGAARDGAAVPLYIHDPDDGNPWRPGAASRWWLHHSLAALDAGLRQRRSRLILRIGKPHVQLRSIIRETGATRVCWNERYESFGAAQDHEIASALRADGVDVEPYAGMLLRMPIEMLGAAGRPLRIFTPFLRRLLASGDPAAPRPAPRSISRLPRQLESERLDDLKLLPHVDWAAGLRRMWRPGEAAAQAALRSFLRGGVRHYDADRNRLSAAGTSRLSPHLHFGEISARTVWDATRRAARQTAVGAAGANAFLRELAWREFSAHQLLHFPHMADEPLRCEFAAFPWREDDAALIAWRKGRTGYPLVDAAMRELWFTGWMHNRARMVAASFLVKHLLLPWQAGARWFWDTLVDADLASNSLNWQWSAGCGIDAAPYFRIFNPVRQGESFDPAGEYVRRWVPELAKLPDRVLHHPWDAPADVLSAAGVCLGRDYPAPIVAHGPARARALAAFRQIRHRDFASICPSHRTGVASAQT